MIKFPHLDASEIEQCSIKDRFSKVTRKDFAGPWKKGGSLMDFLNGLPGILAAGDFRQAAARLKKTAESGGTLILCMGGHPIKVGMAPIIIDLMRRGIISLLAVNGSVMVHDSEVAMIGSTSEDVAASIGEGAFGMGREANELINASAREAAENGAGLGETLGRNLLKGGYPHTEDSVFAMAAELGVPVTVHIAMGTDVYHIHPEADGAAIGKAGFHDFKTFCSAVSTMEGGALINLGSAVIMPEIFLKALTLVRNLGYELKDITTINMDFIRHYRPQVNIVQRPTAEGGAGYYFVGHHEIMFPLLAASLIESLDE